MYSLIHMLGVPNDVVRIKFTPFALKYDAKRWMYGLKVGSIKPWDSFVDIFLKRYFSTSKTNRIRNEILSFVPKHEPFGKYMNRFKELYTQCPYHRLERWDLCQIVYEGLDVSTRIIL